MRKFLLFFYLVLANHIYAQKYFVVLCSKQASLNSFGHAFVVIGKGDAFTCDIDGGDGEAWGLYARNQSNKECEPKGFNALKSFFIGALPGCLFNDINTDISNYYEVKCSFEEYIVVQTIISEWRNKNYELTKSDCLSFLIDVASAFKDRIKLPDRNLFENLPSKYVQKLIDLNR